MLVRELMTHDVEVVAPQSTLKEAAETMRAVDTGALPVCDGDRLRGMLTDRDIVVRGLALGCGPDSTVAEVMSSGLYTVREDAPIEEAAQLMREQQIRRLPVLDENKRLVGIISLGDLSEALPDQKTGATLEVISEPSPGLHH